MAEPPAGYAGTELCACAEARNYYAWILAQFAPYLGQRVVEVGAGIGNFSALLLARPEITELVLVEPSRVLFDLLARRFGDHPKVTVVHGMFAEGAPRKLPDTVVLVNVLEHVPDDQELLAHLRASLPPGGTLLLFVPALSWLYGSLDATFGHVRRYTRSSLRERLRSVGYEVVILKYANLPGVLSWFIAGRVLRRTTLQPREIRLFDRWVVPWVVRMERVWQPPIGQSLLAIARA